MLVRTLQFSFRGWGHPRDKALPLQEPRWSVAVLSAGFRWGHTYLPRIHVQNQDHQRAIELRPEGERSQSGNLGEHPGERGQ